MLNAGVDLDMPFEFVPWDQASAAFEPLIPLNDAQSAGEIDAIVQWPADLHSESAMAWIRDRYNLPDGTQLQDSEIQAIQDLSLSYNEQLRMLGDDWVRGIDFYLQSCWQTGFFTKAPLATYGASSERGFFASSHAVNGWSIVITLKRESCPDLMALRADCAKLRNKRDSAVIQYCMTRGYKR